MFEYEFLKEKNEVSLLSFLENDELTAEEKELIKDEYDGLIQKDKEIEAIIEKYLKGYTLGRMFKVDLVIIKLAVYEMLFLREKMPSKVVINEAVELAKKFSTDKSYSFVNGVLASVYKGEVNGKEAD